MLKLNQIELLNEDDIIVEVMEPIVYEKVGTVIKHDDIIAREKANVYYTVATVVKVHEPLVVATKEMTITAGKKSTTLQFVDLEDNKPNVKRTLNVGDTLIVPRNQITPIQFPIEGYDSPRLGVINVYTPFAFIREDI